MGVFGEPHPHVGHPQIHIEHNINQPKPDAVQPAHVGHHGISTHHHATPAVHTTGHHHGGNHTNHHGPHPHKGHHGHHKGGHHTKK